MRASVLDNVTAALTLTTQGVEAHIEGSRVRVLVKAALIPVQTRQVQVHVSNKPPTQLRQFKQSQRMQADSFKLGCENL